MDGGSPSDAHAPTDGQSPVDASKDDGPSSVDASLDVTSVDASPDVSTDAGGVLVLADNQPSPFGIAVDAQNVYWTTLTSTGTVMECAVGGCGNAPTTLVDGRPDPFIIALDATNVYWTQFGAGGAVAACAITGCNDVPTLFDAPSTFGQGALVVQSGKVFWSDATTSSIYACSATACNESPTVLASNQGYVAGVAADAQNVYWVQFDGGNIVSCAIGGCPGVPTSIVTGLTEPLWLVVDATNVYWSTFSGVVATCPLSGCTTPQVLAQTGGNWVGLALDDQFVYMSDNADATISKCAKTGCNGAPTVLASGQAGPRDVAVDATSVYWANETGGTIVKLDK